MKGTRSLSWHFVLFTFTVELIFMVRLVRCNIPEVCTVCTSATSTKSTDLEGRRSLQTDTNETVVPTTLEKHILDGGNSDCSANPCLKYTQFCGRDNTCYLNSCENFYNFGNELYTGVSTEQFEDDNVPTIECQNIDTYAQVADSDVLSIPIAVLYSCQNNEEDVLTSPRCTTLDETSKYTLFSSRKCIAQDTELNQNFTCYDLQVNTNFTTYKLNTKSAPGYGCTNSSSSSSSSNSTSENIPTYKYNIMIKRRGQEDSSNEFCTEEVLEYEYETIREDYAYGTLLSSLIVGDPVDTKESISPTIAPVQHQPAAGPPAGAPDTNSTSSSAASLSLESYYSLTRTLVLCSFVLLKVIL